MAPTAKRSSNQTLAKLVYSLAMAAIVISILMCLIPYRSEEGITTTIPFRYSPALLMIMSAAMVIITGMLNRRILAPPLVAGLALMVFLAAGSFAWVVLMNHPLNTSFMGKAMTMAALPVGAVIGFHPALRDRAARLTARVGIIAGLIGITMLTLHTAGLIFPDEVQILHEEIVFLVAGPAYLLMRKRSTAMVIAMTILLIGIGIISTKTTTTLLGIMLFTIHFSKGIITTLVGLTRGHSSTKRGNLIALLFPILGIIAMAGAVVFGYTIYERMTRHEVDVRTLAYQERWSQFLESPIFGQGFAMSTNLSDVMGFGERVPSHNDFLDYLAGGGVIAVLLFIACILAAIASKAVLRQVVAKTGELPPVVFFWLLLMFYAVGGSGNPLLVMPAFAVLVWFSVGMVLGYTRHVRLTGEAVFSDRELREARMRRAPRAMQEIRPRRDRAVVSRLG